MRAKEFIKEDQGTTISIPITINIPAGGGMPTISTAQELPPQPVMVTPQQQELELAKAAAGKESEVINQILDDNGAWSEGKESRPFDIAEDFEYLKTEFEQLSEASGDF
jgi:hypothetical protein